MSFSGAEDGLGLNESLLPAAPGSAPAPAPRSSINLFGRGRKNHRTPSSSSLAPAPRPDAAARGGPSPWPASSAPGSPRVEASSVGRFLALATFVVLVIAVPVVAGFGIAERADGEHLVFYGAGFLVLLTLPISIREIVMHLTHWYMPGVQKYVVRILWMVPLYAVQSWLSLRFHHATTYIDAGRNLYEAFVIQSFLYLLIEFLGGQETLIEILRSKDESLGVHSFPFRHVLETWVMGEEFMFQCKWGVLQFVIFKVASTMLILLLEPAGLYDEGSFSMLRGFVYISFVNNISQMWALYSLMMLYYATRHDLVAPVDWKPVGKFLCVKGVIFFTWWQGFGIAILTYYDIITAVGEWDQSSVAGGLQDILICFEMLLFSVAHSYTFTYKEYCPQVDAGGAERGGDAPIGPPTASFGDALWASVVPKETYRDIEKLRHGTGEAVKAREGRQMNIQLLDSEQI